MAVGDDVLAQRRSLTVGDLEISLDEYRVMRGGKSIDMSLTEFRLLAVLAEHPGRVFSREEIVARLWPGLAVQNVRNVDVHVARLRRALNAARRKPLVRTVRRVGYSLV